MLQIGQVWSSYPQPTSIKNCLAGPTANPQILHSRILNNKFKEHTKDPGRNHGRLIKGTWRILIATNVGADRSALEYIKHAHTALPCPIPHNLSQILYQSITRPFCTSYSHLPDEADAIVILMAQCAYLTDLFLSMASGTSTSLNRLEIALKFKRVIVLKGTRIVCLVIKRMTGLAGGPRPKQVYMWPMRIAYMPLARLSTNPPLYTQNF